MGPPVLVWGVADIPPPDILELIIWLHPSFTLVLCKNDKKINGHATGAAKLSPTLSLLIFAVYSTQYTKLSQEPVNPTDYHARNIP